MHDLEYDSAWYKTAPHIHRSVGVLFIIVVFMRLCWKFSNLSPRPIHNHKRWEVVLSKCVQMAMYFILFLMLPTGYFITTAKGQSLDVFNWFSLPALITSIENLEIFAGNIHEILAFSLIGMVSLHALAALKHHIIDKDDTLNRMLFRGSR